MKPIILMLLIASSISINCDVAISSTFHRLGVDVIGTDISADGNNVVGSNGTGDVFRWTAIDGFNTIPKPANTVSYQARAVSLDGTFVAGAFRTPLPGGSIRNMPFRWSEAQGASVSLGTLPDGSRLSLANAISPDGSKVFGSGIAELNIGGEIVSGSVPYQWENNIATPLETLGGKSNTVVGASADGTILAGLSKTPEDSNNVVPVVWNNGVIQPLLTQGRVGPATGVSSNGSVVIGVLANKGIGQNQTPVFWANNSVNEIPLLPGADQANPTDTNHNGSIIVGYSSNSFNFTNRDAFVWTPANSTQSLASFLTQRKLNHDLDNWSELRATAISDNGHVILGEGRNPENERESFVVDTRNIVVLDWGDSDTDEEIPVRITSALNKSFAVPVALAATGIGHYPRYANQPNDIYRDAVVKAVQEIFTNSGVESVYITRDQVTNPGVRAYIAEDEPTITEGFIVHGYDRFNRVKTEDEVIIFTSDSVVDDARTIAHEIGHAYGLRHIDPVTTWNGPGESGFRDGDSVVMDYGDVIGNKELFHNSVARIREKPKEGGIYMGTSHNPLYHLRKYVDHASDAELTLEGLVGSDDYDNEDVLLIPILDVGIAFSQAEGGITELFNLFVLSDEGADIESPVVVAGRESINVSDLDDLLIQLEDTTSSIGIVASSSLGGPLDVFMLPNDPENGIPDSILQPIDLGISNFSLYRESDNAQGFEVLANVALTATILNGDFDQDGDTDGGDFLLWQRDIVTPEGLAIWEQDFGSSPSAASSATKVPEPYSTTLFFVSAFTIFSIRGTNLRCSVCC